MRILIYGGCHAEILRRLLKAHGSAQNLDVDVLINFQLIASGQPFPLADLPGYDLLIYSPIENHGRYSTRYLQDDLRTLGVPAICFPWLEWHGYAPNARKLALSPTLDWAFPDLFDKAAGFADFDLFVAHVLRDYPARAIVVENAQRSSAFIRDAEQRSSADIGVAGFIEQTHRSQRLFQTCDHPSRPLYAFVLREIAARAGLVLDHDAEMLREEPQPEVVVPILPIVAEELKLEFVADPWRDDQVMQDIRAFLHQHYVVGTGTR